MYSFPSASQIFAPSPRSTTNGSPPTPRNARTGELTPPGKRSAARRMISRERDVIGRSFRSIPSPEGRGRVWRARSAPTRPARATPRDPRRRRLRRVEHPRTNTAPPPVHRRYTSPRRCHPLPRSSRLHLLLDTIDERPDGASQPGFVPLAGDQALQLVQSFEALEL